MSDKDESFAQRWSRLKQQARDDEKKLAEAPPPDLPATIGADEPPPAAEDKPEQETPFDPASLPPVESLTKDSDYSLFMRPEVPQDLRQKALRRLWAADPVLSAPDPLDMHNLDYNAVPTFPEGVKTLFRIGQGMLEPEPEKTADAASRQTEQPAAEESLPAEPPPDAAAQQQDLSKIKDSDADKT